MSNATTVDMSLQESCDAAMLHANVEVRLLIDKANRLESENTRLRELCMRFAEYVSQDRCEGCVYKRRCDGGEIDECWQRTEIREIAHKLGIEVE